MYRFTKHFVSFLAVVAILLLGQMAYSYAFTTGHGLMPEIAISIIAVLIWAIYMLQSHTQTDCFEEDQLHDVTNDVFTKHN
jgi:hypothetical protein